MKRILCAIILLWLAFNPSLLYAQEWVDVDGDGIFDHPNFQNPADGIVSSEFQNPRRPDHTGTDTTNTPGADIGAAEEGTVIYSGFAPGFGPHAVYISHGANPDRLDEYWVTVYGHNEATLVQTNDRVARGEHIAEMGHEGYTIPAGIAGTHLHYEVRVIIVDRNLDSDGDGDIDDEDIRLQLIRNRYIDHYENPRDVTNNLPPGGEGAGGGTYGISGAGGVSPGGDHPDETLSIDGMIFPIIDSTNKSFMTSNYVGIIYNGYPIAASFLTINYQAIAARAPENINLEEIKNFPAIIIPSGGLYGLENSVFFKATLDEYVKQGGTLVIFAQQHGYEFSVLPVPQEADGTYRRVSGYGWSEDQSCFTNAVYIDTWHQMLAGQSRITPTLNVDGYFTNYPSNTNVLLRRTKNGQPAMIMYEYGQGRVIVSSMYTDWAYGHGQASKEEIALVRDMISWAKAPVQLPEVRPAEPASVTMSLVNNSISNAASAKLTVLDPNRNILSEQTVGVSLSAGQTTTAPFTYATAASSSLGIYHVDYALLDGDENIIQPQAETDSGRFAVVNPPANPYKNPDFSFSVNSDSEYYAYGSDATFTFTMYNNTDTGRIITAKFFFPHHYWETQEVQYGGDWKRNDLNITNTMVIPPHGSANFTHVLKNARAGIDRLWAYFYDENGKQIGMATRGFYVFRPSVGIDIKTDKNTYEVIDTVNLTLVLKNYRSIGYTGAVNIRVIGPAQSSIYSAALNVVLGGNATSTENISFELPSTVPSGFYTVSVEVFDSKGIKIGGDSSSFEVPLAQISITPDLSSSFVEGENIIPVTLKNIGKVDVSSGVLNINIKDPDGAILYTDSLPVALAIGESRTIDVPLAITELKFGDYVIGYTMLYETRESNVTITIPNSPAISISYDKPSYSVRETAGLMLGIDNTGRFDLNNATVTLSIPDAGYSDSQTVQLGSGDTVSLNYTMSIPETISAGQNAVTVTLSLPSGSSVSQIAKITVPASSLVIGYSDQAAVTAGDTINLTVENTGGIDTNYASVKLYIVDDKGVVIYSGSIAGEVLAGEKKTLTDIVIPSQAVEGAYYLSAGVKDNKTGSVVNLYKPLTIAGLTANLQTSTDKPAYLTTEVITGISTLSNDQFGVENGSLRITATGMKLGDSNFKHFLPTAGWAYMNYPRSIAMGPDGYVYVVEVGNHRIQKFDSGGNSVTKWGSLGNGDGQFYYPNGIAVGPDGSVYVADSSNNRIQKFGSNGNFVTKWGSSGSSNGKFNIPGGVAIGPDGFVYVADTNNNRIQKFGSNGNFVAKWGSYGSGDGQFNSPRDIAVGSDGSVYVVDTGNNRIQKFDSNGNFVAKWGSYGSAALGSANGLFNRPSGIGVGSDGSVYIADTDNLRVQKFDSNGNFITKWGSFLGIFDSPRDVALGPDGSVYVADVYSDRVQKFDSNGTFILKWGSFSDGDGQFKYPGGISLGPDGSVYVADTSNHRIQKFDSNGNFVAKWGSYGSGNGQFKYPSGISVGPDGSVYVADSSNNRIQKFGSNGNFVAKWGSYGDGDGQFKYPGGIAVDHDGSVYVADTSNNRIQKFGSSGTFLTKWGSYGSGDGQLNSPNDIAVGSDGSVYVADTSNNRIQKFGSSGTFLTKWGSYGSGNGQFKYPKGIAVDHDGSVYVADAYNNRIQKFGSNGNFVAKWGSSGDGDGQFKYPRGISVGLNGSFYVADTDNGRIQKMTPPSETAVTFFETTTPLTQAANSILEYITNIGTLDVTGKLDLNAELKNDLGQVIANAEYQFYIIDGNTLLMFSTDKKYYRPGETVTITGEVKNLAAIPASGLILNLSQNAQALYTASFDVPADGSYPFTATTTASAEGIYTLTGTVTQNNSTLVEIMDQYEVANPAVTTTITASDVVGNEPFDIIIEIKNDGKVYAEVALQSSIDGVLQNISIPAGEMRALQYSGQIAASTTYTFSFTGDLVQTTTKTVNYGLGAAISVSPQAVYPEGRVEIPVTLQNTGALDETLTVIYSLEPGFGAESKAYYIPAGSSVSDTLYYELQEGDYTITAISQLPDASAQAAFSVKKENNVQLALSIGARADGLIPATANLTNAGYNGIDGSLRYVLADGSGAEVWSGEQEITALLSGESRALAFDINPSTIVPGNYVVNVSLLINSGQTISSGSAPLTIMGPTFEITQFPPYQTFQLGQVAEMTFSIRNSGNVEGAVELNLSAYDLVNSSQGAWLAAGEEKTFTFGFMLPDDLEEKDYFADYSLLAEDGTPIASGQVKYHLAGINITVNASLDKQNYLEGETAHLTLNIQGQAGTQLPLFARVNYAGYESEQAFTLDGSKNLVFNVPLTTISGEKLFYGIYHELGRSIHLNSLYIHEAGDVLTITTNKQVYNPGETVAITVTGSQGGTLTISVLNHSNTVTLSGTAMDSFALPSEMTAGTYTISVILTTDTGETFSETYHFDVAGMQVKVLECVNDRGKYAQSDTITTQYTISSNTEIAATLKTWIVDPEGVYTPAGETGITLSPDENMLFTGQTALQTDIAGIHRLVYGIYRGDLLLVSGSEAFDVGDAVLLGLSTDKADYPTNTEPVVVTASMFGTVGAELELLIDGVAVQTQQVSLNGFVSPDITIGGVEPGVHMLKGILTAGGLKSTKETGFIYGSALPDLVVRGNQSGDIDKDSNLTFIFTVTNQGETPAGATALGIYVGDTPFETKPVQALNPDGSEDITFVLNALGRSGALAIKAVSDSGNTVVEFDEKNNTDTLTLEIPEATLFTSTGKDTYRVGEDLKIIAEITNLSAVPLEGYNLRTTVESGTGAVLFEEIKPLGSLSATTKSDFFTTWNVPTFIEEGIYRVTQKLLNTAEEVVSVGSTTVEIVASDFSMVFTPAAARLKQGEQIVFTGLIEPLGIFDAVVALSIEGLPSGASHVLNPGALVPPGEIYLKVLTNDLTEAGTHEVKVTGEGDGMVHEAAMTLDIEAFGLEAATTSAEIMQLESATFNVNVISLNGYKGEVDLAMSGVPYGVKAWLDRSSVQVPGTVILKILTSKYVKPGSYEITVSGDDGFVTHKLAFTINLKTNPAIAEGIMVTEGPGPKNEALVRLFDQNVAPILDLMAFDTKYGAYAASADVIGDGYDEIIVSQGPDPKNGAVLRIIGRDGTLLGEYAVFDAKYGVTVAAGDIDGDWADEIVVGMGPDPKNPAEVRILKYNGNGFNEMAIQTLYENMKYGVNTALGDIDGDNIPEIITAPGPDPKSPALIKIWKYNGDDLIEVGSFTAFEGEYGATVTAGDVDGDGFAEIIVGTGPDPKNAAVLRIFKANGTLVGELWPYADEYGYGVNVACVDIDGDYVDEIITGLGPGPQNPAWVKVLRANGTEITNFFAYSEEVKYGVRVYLGRPGKQ